MDRPKDFQPGDMVPGTVYRIVRLIGAGGMGTVYDVEDTTVGKRYVLKTLHPELYSRADLAKRMQAEARTLARLSHPNIVEVVTAGATTDDLRLPFYVMEKLNGQNLRIVLKKKGSLDLPHALHIAIDLLDALDNAHDKGVIHRDVKPDNIFLHRNPNGVTTTKLLDFGIMRLLDAGPGVTAGRFMGTLRYAAPEQLRADTLSAQTDLYAAGLVLYEMIAGRGPFDELKDANKIAAAHLSTAPPLFTSLGVVVPEVLEKVVRSALSKEPAKRPKDAFTFASQLRNMKRTLATEKPGDSATSRPTEVPVVGPMTDAPSSPNQLRLSPSSGPVSEQAAASPAAYAVTEAASTRAEAKPPSAAPTDPQSSGPTLVVRGAEPSAVVAAPIVEVRGALGNDVPTEASPLGPVDRAASTRSAAPAPPTPAPVRGSAVPTGTTEPLAIVPAVPPTSPDWRAPATMRMNAPSDAAAAMDPTSELLALLPTQEGPPSRTDDPASNTVSPSGSTRSRPLVAVAVGLAATVAMIATLGVIGWGISHHGPAEDSAASAASSEPPAPSAPVPSPPPPSAAAAPIPAPTLPTPIDTAPPSSEVPAPPPASAPPSTPSTPSPGEPSTRHGHNPQTPRASQPPAVPQPPAPVSPSPAASAPAVRRRPSSGL
jgi:eukaryotic-like serine/threonine-protein kinase